MKKILFSTTYYAPYISGLTIYVVRIAEELAKKNYQISVITSQHEKTLKTEEILHKVTILRVPYLFRVFKSFFLPSYPVKTFQAVKNADIIILNLPQFEGVLPALWAKLLGKKLYCIYTCEIVLSKNIFLEWGLHLSHIPVLFLSKKIITYTKDYADASFLLPHFKKKLVYIYPPVSRSLVDASIQKELKNEVPKNIKFVIGVAARISREKGIEYLFEAIPLLEKKLGGSFIILIAGPKDIIGEKDYWEKMQGLLRKYQEKIIFLGSIPQEKMRTFYELLDILVLPSVNKTEAFGMVQVEAMLYGVPVVASNLPGIRIPIRETKMGELSMPKDSNDIAQKIIKVLSHKNDYKKSREVIEKTFSLKNTMASYIKLLE